MCCADDSDRELEGTVQSPGELPVGDISRHSVVAMETRTGREAGGTNPSERKEGSAQSLCSSGRAGSLVESILVSVSRAAPPSRTVWTVTAAVLHLRCPARRPLATEATGERLRTVKQ